MKFSRNLMLLAISCAYASAALAGSVRETDDSIYKPTGKGWSELDIDSLTHPQKAATLKAQRRSGNLTLQGGPVMTGPKNIYYIWYGANWDATSKSVLTNLGQNIGGSPYFNINSTYYDTPPARTSRMSSTT